MSDPKQLDFWPRPRMDLREPPESLELILQESPKNQEIQSALVKTYDYIKQHKKIMCSISGGYDSDIMLDMLERCGGHGKVTYIFNNTKLEYDATRRHLEYLEERYEIKIERTEPKKSIPTCVRECGTPFWSKYVSGMISRLQMNRLTFDGPFCDIAQCDSVHGGSFCEDGRCSQRRVWERLKEYEDAGLEPEEIMEMKRAWNAACNTYGFNNVRGEGK